ncbi:hypothetical protein, conserved [Babesia bigemina]|uniref:U3 small nucleolar RNA-associated protein 20 domain-containing protein n=1 Tax=Babesia bigemina TaxID=5866 RepID=A0A061D9T2_BABBI|nr:hypothetical protein, conserved [Babesia bigemina]CDR95674.1 hypothetical protein, conserved [Babesia bigemina]|eukprot:XP_012767860.1 hypothetical protein, conserved [Babesia bigemina]
MTNRGKFKFESASKRSRSLVATDFSDIRTVVRNDGPLEKRRFFLHHLRNTLRSKDLLTHKQTLKDILNKSGVWSDGPPSSTLPFPEWSAYVVESLLRCAQSANSIELTTLCRLLAIFFKDYGDQDCLKVPFVGLLEVLEANKDSNAEAIFSFISTHFRSNSRCVSQDLGDLLTDFQPWLGHSYQLIRRLSMESLSLLLRRVPDTKLRDVLCRLLCMYVSCLQVPSCFRDGSEHLFFGIIKNVNGTFTTKLHPLLKFVISSLISDTFEPLCDGDVVDARRSISSSMRRAILLMSRHCRGAKLSFDWLDNLYDEIVCKYNDAALSPSAASAYSIGAELCVELLTVFRDDRRIKIKDIALVRSGACFDSFLSDYVVPLLSFAKEMGTPGAVLFEELSQLLARVVRTPGESANVLHDRFGEIIDYVFYFMSKGGNINPLMVLFEWRLKCDNLEQIAHFLLLISQLFDCREVFHPILVNPAVIARIWECIEASMENIARLRQERAANTDPVLVSDWAARLEMAMSVIFGCVKGLRSILALRCRMTSLPLEVNCNLLESILRECTVSLKAGESPDLVSDVFLQCCLLLEEPKCTVWVELLVGVANENPVLLSNPRILDEFCNRFTASMEATVVGVLALFPNERVDFRQSALRLFALYMSSKNANTVALDTLLEMERLESSMENERRKSLLMAKSVDELELRDEWSSENEMLVEMVFKVLLSQYYVKFAPNWEASSESHDKLLVRLKSAFSAKRRSTLDGLLKKLWTTCFEVVNACECEATEAKTTLPEFVVPFVVKGPFESTDPVTRQREVLSVMTSIISHTSNKESYIRSLCSYTVSHMLDDSKEIYRKNSLATVSSLLQKYKVKDGAAELVGLCLRDGIRSSDNAVREYCLSIVATSYPGLNTKRLQEVSCGNVGKSLDFEHSSPASYVADSNMQTLAVGIEIRLICPRIPQTSKQMHGNYTFDYLSRFDARYLNLLIAELLPGPLKSLFLTESDMAEPFYAWMVDLMCFNAELRNQLPLQKAIRTLSVLFMRLKKNLTAQSVNVFECCARILASCAGVRPADGIPEPLDIVGSKVDALIGITIELMIDLIDTFDELIPRFVSILSQHRGFIDVLLGRHKEVLSLVVCLTNHVEHLALICSSLIGPVLFRIFRLPPTSQLLELMDNLYCKYAPSLVSSSSPGDTVLDLLIAEAGAVLVCIKDYKPMGTHIMKAILLLPVNDDQRRACLSILLSNLPNVRKYTAHKTAKEASMNDQIQDLRRLLDCLKLCVSLLSGDDEPTINAIWDFANDCLFHINDLYCRRLCCEVLSSLPVEDISLESVCAHLHSMNYSNNNSIDAKIDFDSNCDHLTSLAMEFEEQTPSPKVVLSALSHALFVLLIGHKEPGLRRSVLTFTSCVIGIIHRSMRNGNAADPVDELPNQANCDYIDTSSLPYSALLLKAIFPFVRRCLGGAHLRESLFYVSIEVLEQFGGRFCEDVGARGLLTDSLHSDLCNVEVVECLSKLRNVHKYTRNEGLKQLSDLLSRDVVFSPDTTYRFLVPMCIQFLTQSQSPGYGLFCENARKCLISCGGKLSGSTLLKFLRQLIEVYDRHQVTPTLHVFSGVLQALPVTGDGSESGFLCGQDSDNDDSQWMVHKFRGMLARSQPDGDDIPCVEAYEALGSLLCHHSKRDRDREVIKYCRIICKSLCSRGRDPRRYGRQALKKFLHCMGFCYFPTVLKELSSNLTRGFQLYVLIFTTHSLLSSFAISDSSLKIRSGDDLDLIFRMITTEMLVKHEKQDTASKIDEERQSKSSSLLELLSEFGDIGVCLDICRYLWSLLKGSCNMPPDSSFEYSNTFLRNVDNLMSCCVRGFTANKHVDLYCLASVLFYGFLPSVKGVPALIKKELPSHISSEYTRVICNVGNYFKSFSDTEAPPVTSSKQPESTAISNTKKEEYYTLYPGASTGRSLAKAKKMGFDDHILSPLFVNAALRLYGRVLSTPENVFFSSENTKGDCQLEPIVSPDCVTSASNIAGTTTAFVILICFLCDDVTLQRSSVSCLFHLCSDSGRFMDMCGSVLADSLVKRLGTLHFVGSEDMVKDYLRLVGNFLQSRSHNILFNAWKKSGRSNELVAGLLLQIEANLDRPGLQSALLKLFNRLVVMEVSISRAQKTLYEVFQEVFIRMLKGALTPSAMRLSSRAVAQFLTIVPMEESNRSKRFGLLLKHVTSSISLVRLTVLQCLHQLLKNLTKKGSWKRYSELVGVGVAMQLLSESDLQCKRVMANIISLIWRESPVDQKRGLLECLAYFLGNSSGCKDAAYAYFLFHCLSNETSISWIRKSRVLDLSSGFLGLLEDLSCVKPSGPEWQAPYYWLRILCHILSSCQNFDFLFAVKCNPPADDPTSIVMNKVWVYTIKFGVRSSHPWIRAASLRVLTLVLNNRAAYDSIQGDPECNIYGIARPCLKLLSIETGMVERHEKVATALESCLQGIVHQTLSRASKTDSSIARVVSKVCYNLRLCLGKSRHCCRRIDILMSLLREYTSSTRAFESFLRATLLRVMIALTRATKCDVYISRSEGEESVSDEGTAVKRRSMASGIAREILSTIESHFRSVNDSGEYLKLLSFAQDFVSRRRILRMSKTSSSHAGGGRRVSKKRKRHQ